MSKVLYRIYRPAQFKDVTGQGHIVKTLQNQLKDNALGHAYVFAGPRGVGKTTIARLLAKTANCTNRVDGCESCGACASCEAFDQSRVIDVLEMDAATHTQVEKVREHIIEACRFAPTSGAYKIFIIDEVHMLSGSSFNALLKTLEEPPEYVLFILATTEAHKIPATVLSRCQRFDFHRLTSDEIVERLTRIAVAEGYEVDETVFHVIAKLSEGCLRDAETLLGQIFTLGEKHITASIASLVLPHTDNTVVLGIIDACEQYCLSSALHHLQGFVEQGGSTKQLCDGLIEESRARMMKCMGEGKPWEHFMKLTQLWLRTRTLKTPEALGALPLEMAIFEWHEGRDVQESSQDDSKDKGGSHDSPQPPVLTDDRPEQKGDAPEAPKQPEFTHALLLEDLRAKWGRCCEEVGKQSITLPLALREAELVELNEGELTVEFKNGFYFDSVNQKKNLDLIAKAIRSVTQKELCVIARHVQKKERAGGALEGLANAFGGAVVE